MRAGGSAGSGMCDGYRVLGRLSLAKAYFDHETDLPCTLPEGQRGGLG